MAALDRLGREARVAVDVVRAVVAFMRRVEAGAVGRLLTKDDSTPVTAIDFAVQAFVASRLARECDDIPLVAEEDSASLRADAALADAAVAAAGALVPDIDRGRLLDLVDRGAGTAGSRFWVLDPIDGTKGLLHGRQYATALALIHDGRVEVGVVGCPRLPLGQDVEGGVAVAARGRGAWWTSPAGSDAGPLAVSRTSALSVARVIRSWEDSHGDVERLGRILDGCGNRVPPVRMDSQAKHVALAAGSVDVLFRLPLSSNFRDAVWDCAAGALLIGEAGGRVTDLSGTPLDFSAGRRLVRNDGCVASNGALHEAALEAVRSSR